MNYDCRTKNYNKLSDQWQFCVLPPLDVTKSRVSVGHLCWILFSKVSWFKSAIECANNRFHDLSTFYYTISIACSYLHSLGGAYSASGSETNHKYVVATRMPHGFYSDSILAFPCIAFLCLVMKNSQNIECFTTSMQHNARPCVIL